MNAQELGPVITKMEASTSLVLGLFEGLEWANGNTHAGCDEGEVGYLRSVKEAKTFVTLEKDDNIETLKSTYATFVNLYLMLDNAVSGPSLVKIREVDEAIRSELDLAPGAYLLGVEQDGRLVQAQRFVVTQ